MPKIYFQGRIYPLGKRMAQYHCMMLKKVYSSLHTATSLSSHLLESFDCSMSSYFRRMVLADCPGVFVEGFCRFICVCKVEVNSVIFFSLPVLSFRERFFKYQTPHECIWIRAWISQCISREGPAIFYNSSLALTYFVPQDGCQTKYVNIFQQFPDGVKV